MPLNNKTIMIAGGGTGGHIYPAVAIGRALQKSDSAVQIRFVGTAEGLESKILTREGLDLSLIYSGQLNLSGQFTKKIKTLLKIPVGLLQSVYLIIKYRPAFVLGVGGYASAPFVLMAALLGRKTALWEPNAHPGMANRWLSRFVRTSYLVFADSQKSLASKHNKVLGMPLREDIEKAVGEEKSQSSGQMTLLCFGGSQGSVFLNEKISNVIIQNPDLCESIHLIHQTGSRDYQNIKSKYEKAGVRHVDVHEFIYDMPFYYKKAHVQFCRGGASTLAEACAFGVLPLVVPLPAADDHQLRNAEVLVKNKAGYLFDQASFDEAFFANTLRELLAKPELRREMSENLKKLAPRRAAYEIAHDILKQI